jgi:hypothetical protein
VEDHKPKCTPFMVDDHEPKCTPFSVDDHKWKCAHFSMDDHEPKCTNFFGGWWLTNMYQFVVDSTNQNVLIFRWIFISRLHQ